MDLPLYFRVLWRFRFIVAAGFILAVSLSFLSVAKVSLVKGKPVVTYRTPTTWESTATLFASPSGYPWRQNAVITVDPTTFAVIAAGFANSDQVRRILARNGGVPGGIQAYAQQNNDGQTLPFVTVNGLSSSASGAVLVADRAAAALKQYVVEQQVKNGVAPQRQLQLQIVNRASAARVATPRKKTLPVLIFVLIMAMTVAAAFILENMRPRLPKRLPVPAEAKTVEAADARLSA